jgi:hypothetical protein
MANPDPETKISRRTRSMAAEVLFEAKRTSTPATAISAQKLDEDGRAARLLEAVKAALDEAAIRESAEMAEIRSMLDRIDRDLTAEEALTRQLMARHGL